MLTIRIVSVLGTRPEIVKMAPVIRALRRRRHTENVLVHSGQHYDPEMSEVFFKELGLPPPDENLRAGSGSHARQTSRMMVGLERLFRRLQPDLVLAAGDTNTVVAAGLVARKMRIPFGHVEAGLRCYDEVMPEEINRVIADTCAKLCFAPTPRSALNLLYEGIPPTRIHVTGNTIVDAVQQYIGLARRKSAILESLGLSEGEYAVLTLHRAENVDAPGRLTGIVGAILELCRKVPIVFPVHPRTVRRLIELNLYKKMQNTPELILTRPLGYLDFLRLLSGAALALTDSGGVQEEALTLRVPCLTLRNNTERPETVECGANIIAGTDPERIRSLAEKILSEPGFAEGMRVAENPLGDGRAGERIADISVDAVRAGLQCESPVFLETGSASFSLQRVDDKWAGKTVAEFSAAHPGWLVTLIYDSAGAPVFPAPDTVLREGSFLRVFAPHIRGLPLTPPSSGGASCTTFLRGTATSAIWRDR